MSNSLWPYGLYLSKLFCPYESPDKNTGVGCHSLLQFFTTSSTWEAQSTICVLSRSVVSNSLQPMDCNTPGPSAHGDSPGKNARDGCHALLQRIFPTQGSSPGLLHYKQILYRLSHQGSPRILEWVAYTFSRGRSWPGNQTGLSCIADGVFINWAT